MKPNLKPYLHWRWIMLPITPLFAAAMAARFVMRRSFCAECLEDFFNSYKWWICTAVGVCIRGDAGWYRLYDVHGGCGPWKWHWKNPGEMWSVDYQGAWPVE